MSPTASASAKVILLGEHAVVYGIPALAVPVRELRATATFTPGGRSLRLLAPDIHLDSPLEDLSPEEPLAAAVRLAGQRYRRDLPAGVLELRSEIPIAAGMGSGAAVATAVVRVLAEALGKAAGPEEVSALVFEVERLHHGTPSGIDNTVIAYEKPLYFVRGQPPVPLAIGRPFHLMLADSGLRSLTRDAVAGVRERLYASPGQYHRVLASIGRLVETGRVAMDRGDEDQLGRALSAGHRELQALQVSNPRLDSLVAAALSSGALGAKLSGAGLGGIVIALVRPSEQEAVAAAWRALDVTWMHTTCVGSPSVPPDPADPAPRPAGPE